MSRNALIPDRRVLLALIALSLLTLCAAGSFAQEEKKPTPSAGPAPAPAAAAAQKSAAAPANAAEPAAPTVTFKKPAQSPMITELMALLAGQDEKLADLAARQKKATTGDEAIAVQREIQELKLGTEISMLRIQATYARREGRTADADRLDGVVRDLVSPPKLGVPSNRPAPVRTDSPR